MRNQGWIALIVLGLALCGSTALQASNQGTHPPVGTHPEVPQSVQKSANGYNKQLHKSMKQNDKAQRKDMKNWKKYHPGTKTSITG
jgi:hypothetical protein